MSTGMPELGSKISLISKADIRYEGRLFTVDPTECTIALANVRSFGTEDRETQYPILPQPTIYDYILFRGSDIKDIRVVNNVTIPNDPAIMQMHLPPNQQMAPPQQQSFPPQGFPMQSPHMGPQMNAQFNAPFGMTPNNMVMGGNLAPGSGPSSNNNSLNSSKKQSELNINLNHEQPQQQLPSHQAHHHKTDDDSRSGTPNNMMNRKSPTADMGVQTNQNQQNNLGGNKDKIHNKSNQRQNQQPHNNNQQQNNQMQRERRDSGKQVDQQDQNTRYRNQRPNQYQNQHPQHQQFNNQMHQNRGWNQNPNQNRNQSQNNQQMMRGGSAGGAMRGGRSDRGGPPQQGYRQQQQQQQQQGQGNEQRGINPNQNQGKPNPGNRQPKTTLKFENDYDFEQANNKFEEMRSEIAKLKVGDEVKPEQVVTEQQPQVNGGETEKKDDSGNETGAGDNEAEDDPGYDKRKSFFDNISCEAVERSKGKTQRTDWRQERKLNSETFGVSLMRRGGFRGRGGYYNRGPSNYRGNNYRGNSNGNYRTIRGGGQQRNHQNGGPQNSGPRNNSQTQQAPSIAAAVVAGEGK